MAGWFRRRGLTVWGLAWVLGSLALAAPAQAGRVDIYPGRFDSGSTVRYVEEQFMSNRVTMRATALDGAVRHVRITDAGATIVYTQSPPNFLGCFVSLDGHAADCVSLPQAASEFAAVDAGLYALNGPTSFVVEDGSAPLWLLVSGASFASTGTQTRVRAWGTSGADRFEIGPTTDPRWTGDVKTFAGDDIVNARNGSTEEIDCGDGADEVTADASDVLLGCETVAP
jgi:hypothetical protein